MRRAPIERFTEKYVKKLVVVGDKLLCCWVWTAQRDEKGYGYFAADHTGRKILAHRWSYEHFIGPIPDGKQIDHYRCWNTSCVNPAHLRPATAMENHHNGRINNAVKKACKYGHPFTPENTRMVHAVDLTGRAYIQRRCRTCAREWMRRQRAA